MKKYNSIYPMYSEFNSNSINFNDNSLPNYMPNYNSYQSIYLPSGLQMPEPDEEGYDESDIEYMKSMYPDFCKRIQAYIDEECDRLEYDGSYMYDEYPDRDTIDRITDKIHDLISRDETIKTKELEVASEDIKGQQFYRNYDLQRDLIKILLLNELFNRRRFRYYGDRYTNRRYRYSYPPYYYRNYFY